MRILDINDNELQEEELDLELGYLEEEEIITAHHDAVKAKPRIFHYAVQTVYFDDGSFVNITKKNDPRIKVIDASIGSFEYIQKNTDNPKKIRNFQLKEIEDRPAVEGSPAWDEFETIKRYIAYTAEELEERAVERQRKEEEETRAAEEEARLAELQAARDAFLDEAPNRLQSAEENINNVEQSVNDANSTLEDLILIMADIVAGADENTPIEPIIENLSSLEIPKINTQQENIEVEKESTVEIEESSTNEIEEESVIETEEGEE